jgi:hypothetical protein
LRSRVKMSSSLALSLQAGGQAGDSSIREQRVRWAKAGGAASVLAAPHYPAYPFCLRQR